MMAIIRTKEISSATLSMTRKRRNWKTSTIVMAMNNDIMPLSKPEPVLIG